MFFVVSSQYLSLLLTQFDIETGKILYFSVFSPRKFSSPSNFYNKTIIIVQSIVKNHKNFLRYTIF